MTLGNAKAHDTKVMKSHDATQTKVSLKKNLAHPIAYRGKSYFDTTAEHEGRHA